MSNVCLIPEECNSKDALFTVIDFKLKGQLQLNTGSFLLAQYLVSLMSSKLVAFTSYSEVQKLSCLKSRKILNFAIKTSLALKEYGTM